MNPSGIITLTTDFGTRDSYVAQMKGVMLGISPHAVLVDVSHAISPQDVEEASIILKDLPSTFPAGTVHLVVIDPGVGTHRGMLAVSAHNHYFVAPDNGILTPFLDVAESIIELSQPAYWRETSSTTFHGRDRMGPVAAYLSRGIPLTEFGSPLETSAVRIADSVPIREGNTLKGKIVRIDHFGNLITNLHTKDLPIGLSRVSITYREHQFPCLQQTYGAVPPGEVLSLIGSSGLLEIAVNGGSAQQRFSAKRGDAVRVELPEDTK